MGKYHVNIKVLCRSLNSYGRNAGSRTTSCLCASHRLVDIELLLQS